jgi:hypothetical protein
VAFLFCNEINQKKEEGLSHCKKRKVMQGVRKKKRKVIEAPFLLCTKSFQREISLQTPSKKSHRGEDFAGLHNLTKDFPATPLFMGVP